MVRSRAGDEGAVLKRRHILGSASVELEIGGSRLLFPGDLGPDEKALSTSEKLAAARFGVRTAFGMVAH